MKMDDLGYHYFRKSLDSLGNLQLVMFQVIVVISLGCRQLCWYIQESKNKSNGRYISGIYQHDGSYTGPISSYTGQYIRLMMFSGRYYPVVGRERFGVFGVFIFPKHGRSSTGSRSELLRVSQRPNSYRLQIATRRGIILCVANIGPMPIMGGSINGPV